MNLVLAAATVVATIVLLASLQWLAVVLRELPSERRPRRAGRVAPTRVGSTLPELRQLERLAEEALAGDRLAVARLAGLGASASQRSGVPTAEAEARTIGSPTALLAALDRWETAVATARGRRPTDGPRAAGGVTPVQARV